MTHRAVGICSAVKSDQFRAVTEMTINRLLQAAQSQVEAMQKSLDDQRKINEMGTQNMKDFQEYDEKRTDAHADSLNKLKLAGNLIDENLISLQQELELRQRSEEKLSDIEKSASEISHKLEQHTSELNVGHELLLKNVDEISANLQKNNLELLQQYNQMLEFINSFKSVVQVGVKILGNIKSCFGKLAEIAEEVGLELSNELIAFLILNLAYFTCGMLFMLFIGAKWTSRSILIVLFAFNSIAAYFRSNVEFLPLNLLVWITFFSKTNVSLI